MPTVTLPGGKTTEVEFCTEGLDRLRIGLVQSGLDPNHFLWPPENDPDRPPYRGLLPSKLMTLASSSVARPRSSMHSTG
jgi:hypothetical protein